MAKKAVDNEGFITGVKKLLAGAREDICYRINDSLRSPMSWKLVFWDSNIMDEFPDHIMRIMRFLMGIASVAKIINFIYLGAFLVVDSIYTIYRYRVEISLTKSWHEDAPRVARLFFGFILMKGLLRL